MPVPKRPYVVQPDTVGKQKCFRVVGPDKSYIIVGYRPKPNQDPSTPRSDAEMWADRLSNAYQRGRDSRDSMIKRLSALVRYYGYDDALPPSCRKKKRSKRCRQQKK